MMEIHPTPPICRFACYVIILDTDTLDCLALTNAGIILGMGSTNERWHYIIMLSLIGWALGQNDPSSASEAALKDMVRYMTHIHKNWQCNPPQKKKKKKLTQQCAYFMEYTIYIC